MVGRVRVAAEEPQTEKGMALFKEAFARCFRRGKGVVSMHMNIRKRGVSRHVHFTRRRILQKRPSTQRLQVRNMRVL